MLSVANSCHYIENFKNGKNLLWTNARLSGATPTNSPRAKARMQKPQVGANFWCKSLWVRKRGGGGMVMDEIDTCITVCSLVPFGGLHDQYP